MIWALLFALIFSGSESVLLNTKVDKHIKRHVESPENKKQLLGMLKDYEKVAKAFRKEKKKFARELDALNANRDATEEAFSGLFKRYFSRQNEIDRLALKTRMKSQQLIAEAEWENILSDASEVYEKGDKKRDKYISNLQKSISKAKSKAGNIIEDESRKQQIQRVLADFKSAVVDIQLQYNSYNYIDNNLLNSRQSTESELHELQKEINDLKQQFFDAYLNTHMELVELSTEAEWDDVIKAMNEIF